MCAVAHRNPFAARRTLIPSELLGAVATGARIVHVVLLGLWAGGVAFFWLLKSRIDAVIPSAHMAEALLRDLQQRLDEFGLAAGPLVLLTLLAGWGPQQVPLRRRVVSVILACTLAGVCSRWLAPRRSALVDALGTRIENLQPNTPQALELVRFDHLAVGSLALQGLIATLLMAAAVRGSQPRRRFGIEL